MAKLEGPAKSNATTVGSLESYLLEVTGVPDEGRKNVRELDDALKQFRERVESLDWTGNAKGMKECTEMSNDDEKSYRH